MKISLAGAGYVPLSTAMLQAQHKDVVDAGFEALWPYSTTSKKPTYVPATTSSSPSPTTTPKPTTSTPKASNRWFLTPRLSTQQRSWSSKAPYPSSTPTSWFPSLTRHDASFALKTKVSKAKAYPDRRRRIYVKHTLPYPMNFQSKIIATISLGYVGLPLTVEFGKYRDTLGFDIKQARMGIR